MILNAYGSAILRSEMGFHDWAKASGVKNPVKKGYASEPKGETKEYDRLIQEGYQVRKSPIVPGVLEKNIYTYIKREGGPEAEEQFKVEQFLYQYIYIANAMGIVYADDWIEQKKEDKYKQVEYARAVKNKPKLAYCHLTSSNGQCDMSCPYFERGCSLTSADELASRALLEKYKPVKDERRYR